MKEQDDIDEDVEGGMCGDEKRGGGRASEIDLLWISPDADCSKSIDMERA